MYALFWQMDAMADNDRDPWGLGGQCAPIIDLFLCNIFFTLYILQLMSCYTCYTSKFIEKVIMVF